MFGFVDAAPQPPVGLFDRQGGGLQPTLPRGCFLLGAFEAVCVLHRRIRAQGLEPGLFAFERDLCIIVCRLGVRFLGLRFIEPSLCFAARPAGVVELGLGLAQRAGLPAALRAGVDAVSLVEALDGLGQGLLLIELAAIFLQLAKRLGDIAEQFGCQRR